VAKIEQAIRDAVARGARREVRRVAGPLRRELRRARAAVKALRQEIGALRALAERWRTVQGERGWEPGVSEEEARAARLSPKLVRALRTRLGLSQASLGQLVGVSGAAVVAWERGRAAPAGRNRAALVALRRVGRRDAKRLLASVAESRLERGRRPAAARRPKSRPPARRPARGR
jgi:DNA-binding transcriptional regulator YiaG